MVLAVKLNGYVNDGSRTCVSRILIMMKAKLLFDQMETGAGGGGGARASKQVEDA